MGMSVGAQDDYNVTMNVVPLIDIMLVLLIIFIITLPVMTHAVKIDLPRATNTPPPEHPAPPVNIDVQYNGTVLWDGAAGDARCGRGGLPCVASARGAAADGTRGA